MRGRTDRVISVVMAEMENFERGPYTEGVEKTVRSLKEDSKYNEQYILCVLTWASISPAKSLYF